jgi:TnsA endonuclease N terminal/TnsA endonuclease C terminal
MPVRKIPKNHLLVTGGYSSRKNPEMDPWESILEKEFLLLQDFDDTVEKFETQPVRIPVPGVPRGYVPDVLVWFLPDPDTGLVRRPWLVEVKHSSDLKRNELKYAPKFAAARQYAEGMGWDFEIVEESQIRTPRLENLKFLRAYRNIAPSEEDVQRVLEFIGDDETSSLALLETLAPTAEEQLYWLPIIWSMLLTRHLVTDLDQSFSNDVPLRRTGDNV